jgi:tRNA pseudouridine synthase 10
MYRLCASCLKRLGLEGTPTHCELCGDIFERMDALLDFTYVAEFSTFNIGIKLSSEMEEKEKGIMNELHLSGEKTLKRELLSVLRKKIRKKFGKEVQFENPDVIFLVDLEKETVKPQTQAAYIKGRYTKHVRDIPQTKWYCRKCRGKGCSHCNFTGKMYETSVEEIIAEVVLAHSRAADEKFHGAGREDIDARMLGDGRPFVIELQCPEIRSIDLNQITAEINTDERVHVRELAYTDKKEIVRLKKGKFDKMYLAHLDSKITDEDRAALSTLREIHQQTPQRVQHRRANKVRIRKVYKVGRENSNCLKIRCESGLYVKELITGDDGRTVPSVSSILQKDVKCIALDVVKIYDR